MKKWVLYGSLIFLLLGTSGCNSVTIKTMIQEGAKAFLEKQENAEKKDEIRDHEKETSDQEVTFAEASGVEISDPETIETEEEKVSVERVVEQEMEMISYLDAIDALIAKLELQQSEYGYFEGNGVEIRTSDAGDGTINYTINNTENTGLLIYGLRLGVDYSQFNEILLSNGWIYDSEVNHPQCFYSILNNHAYGIRIETDGNNQVSGWEICNWFDIDIPYALMVAYYNTLEPWMKLYLEYLKENCLDDFPDLKVSLVYIDEDNIPEMIMESEYVYGGGCVCSIKDGVVNDIMVDSYSISYLEKTGLVLESGGRQGVYWDKIYRLNQGIFEQISEGAYEITYEGEKERTSYQWNGEMLKKEQYQEQRNKVFDIFAAKNPYESSVSYWEFLYSIGGDEHPYPTGM